MAFHFLNPLFLANTFRRLSAPRLFLTRPCPQLQAEHEAHEERRRTGGLFKKKGKHQGYVLKSLGHATVSTAKQSRDCCVFTNMVNEVMVQTIILANWIM